ncbi:MAG: protein jag [Clostridia bacterium]|nr:protein jag [Clostridia bacterium]
MRSVEVSAKTVEEAVKIALEKLNLTEDEVNIEILEHPNKGFLGFLGSKNALVRVEEKYDPLKAGQKFLEKIFSFMKLEPTINIVEEDEYTIFNLSGKDLGILIGRRGETLDSLQFLLNLVVNKNLENRVKYIIDVEGYRSRRENTLADLANRLAKKVIRTGRKVVLEPMNPQERRIIHLTLQDNKYITTYSEGEEPYRKVVIVPKKQA